MGLGLAHLHLTGQMQRSFKLSDKSITRSFDLFCIIDYCPHHYPVGPLEAFPLALAQDFLHLLFHY